MYTLTFNKSKSKYFQKVLEICEMLGGKWDGETMTINISDELLLDAYDVIHPLFMIIQNWKSTKANYNSRNVPPYKFLLSMHFIKDCAEKRRVNLKNCWLSDKCQGWGCKKISNISYQELGNGNYKANNRYWYNFGHFNKNEWIIHKNILYEKLLNHLEKNALLVCPYFQLENVKIAVQNLPNKIIPDDISYRIHYAEIYSNGQKVFLQENIRHIPKENPHTFGNRGLFAVIGKIKL